MTGFILGVIFTLGFIAGNDAAKTLMTKVHANNDEEMAKMKIPGYPMYSYYKFKRSQSNDTDKTA